MNNPKEQILYKEKLSPKIVHMSNLSNSSILVLVLSIILSSATKILLNTSTKREVYN